MNQLAKGEDGFSVELSTDALFVYLRVSPDSEADQVDSMLELLGQFPYIGGVYDPLYEAARPQFEMRVVYTRHYGIYYEVDDSAKRVNVLFIEDQRRNPNSRFGDIEEFYG